jgi:hypothetical protein
MRKLLTPRMAPVSSLHNIYLHWVHCANWGGGTIFRIFYLEWQLRLLLCLQRWHTSGFWGSIIIQPSIVATDQMNGALTTSSILLTYNSSEHTDCGRSVDSLVKGIALARLFIKESVVNENAWENDHLQTKTSFLKWMHECVVILIKHDEVGRDGPVHVDKYASSYYIKSCWPTEMYYILLLIIAL